MNTRKINRAKARIGALTRMSNRNKDTITQLLEVLVEKLYIGGACEYHTTRARFHLSKKAPEARRQLRAELYEFSRIQHTNKVRIKTLQAEVQALMNSAKQVAV